MHEVTPSTTLRGTIPWEGLPQGVLRAALVGRQGVTGGKECPQGLPTCQTLQCKRDLLLSTHLVLFVGGNRKNVLSTCNGD